MTNVVVAFASTQLNGSVFHGGQTAWPKVVHWMPFRGAGERPRTADRPFRLSQYPKTESAAGEREVPA